jgi:hypothetical protein
VRGVTPAPRRAIYTARVKLIVFLGVAAAATIGFVTALLTGGGCASNCGADCPATMVYIGSANNQELNGILTDIEVDGDGCPPRAAALCVGDRSTPTCTHVTITAPQPGACNVLFTFSDRPSEIVRLQFGPTINANGSCCKGYPVAGPSVYTIPVKPTGPIYSGSVDAGTYSTDAVVVMPTDAGAGGG